MQKNENQTKIFLISIIAIIAVVLLVNNFNKMSGAVTYSPDAIRYGNCVLDQDCNLKTGDVTYLNDIKIMIGTIGSRGDVRIGVNEEVITIGKAEKVIVKGLEITNKVTYYDWRNSKNNYVVLFIAEEGGLSKEVTYQGVLDMLNNAELFEKDLNSFTERELGNDQAISCNEICSNMGKICIHAAVQSLFYGDWKQWIYHASDCNTNHGVSSSDQATILCWCAK